jgi:chorismate mutase
METNKTHEREHDFALVLAGITELTPDAENALFEAGCDDATISIRFGRVYLTFSRTAASLKEAILSAIRDIKKANLGADVLRVDVCNLVTQADIARRIGRSRQLVHQYISGARGPGHFPSPACDVSEGAPLWNWCEVAQWLRQNDMIREDVLREAQEVAVINSVLELQYQRQLAPALTEEVLREIGSSPIPA